MNSMTYPPPAHKPWSGGSRSAPPVVPACWTPPKALNPRSPGTFLVVSAMVAGWGLVAGFPLTAWVMMLLSTSR